MEEGHFRLALVSEVEQGGSSTPDSCSLGTQTCISQVPLCFPEGRVGVEMTERDTSQGSAGGWFQETGAAAA